MAAAKTLRNLMAFFGCYFERHTSASLLFLLRPSVAPVPPLTRPLLPLRQSETPDFTQPIQLSMNYRLSSARAEEGEHSPPADPVLIATDVTKRAHRVRRQGQSVRQSVILSVSQSAQSQETRSVCQTGSQSQSVSTESGDKDSQSISQSVSQSVSKSVYYK